MNKDFLNSILENLDFSKFQKVDYFEPDTYHSEKYQGVTSKRWDVYDLGQDNLFLKVTYEIDSYGAREEIVGLKFVESTTKTVTVYE